MPFAAAPSLHTHHEVAFIQNAELDALRDTPYQTLVNILLPISILEVRLGLGKEERIDTAVEVRVLWLVSNLPFQHTQSHSREKLWRYG